MGYKFSLVLSREITDDEVTTLQTAGCASANFTTDSLPTNADVLVARLDFDDESSPSLTEAIESALAAVKEVPDLSVPGLTVPAQPAQADGDTPSNVIEGVVVEEKPAAQGKAAQKPAPKKASNGKAGAKKTSAAPAAESATVSVNGDASADLVDAAVKSD